MDKNELVNKIRGIEGLTNDEKSTLIELLRKQKKYGLVWEDKPEDVEERLRVELPVLTEDIGKAIISEEVDAPNHILIEGDNLEALTALAYTHEGKIDVIYIDPPYNTGNKDFVYNDKFVDHEDAYRHSKWLSFMSKRLRIAKQLLSDTGVIFISIDDNEQAQLKLLCDEIFGENNFISKFDWRKKTGANDAKDIAVITESVLLYAKNHSLTILNNIWARDETSVNKNRYKLSDEYIEERGMYYLDTLDRGGLQYSDSMNFGIEAPDGGIIYPNGRSEFVNDGWIWKWGKEKVKWGIENKFLEFVKSKKSQGSKYTIKYKVYQYVDNEGNIRERSGRAFTNLIIDPINQQGNIDITNVFDGMAVFSNPKPIGLIQYLLKVFKNKSFYVLDFFAGSGTTLHATMQLNAEDGGHRKCILVTNNENNICENVTYVRNKRVIQGYTTPKGEDVPGLTSNTLRYYRTDFVPREKTQKNMRALVAAATDMLCIKNDIYTETHEIGGAKMRPSLARHFKNGYKEMLIIYDDRAIPYIVDKLKDIDVKEPIMVYVFSPNDYPYTDEFFEVADKVKLCALPAAIYETYSKVLKRPKPHFLDEEKEKMVEAEKEDGLDELFTTIDEEGGEA
jgi:adenine-specific DNA-methyltransferase